MKEINFEICVRAIIQKGSKILACYNKKEGFYFFPGGHIEFGEKAEKTLSRELKEELDILIKKQSLIGVVENVYNERRKKHHEINLVFEVKTNKINTKSKEDHIDFCFLDIENFFQKDVLPIALKKSLLKWFKDKKTFWASQIYNKSTLNNF